MSQRAVADPSVDRNSAMVLEEIARLDGIVERLLYFARPMMLTIAPVDLCDLLRECAESRKMLIGNAGVSIRYEPAPTAITIHGDGAKLREVFDNLLSNAIQAVNGVGSVVLSSRVQDGFACVECRDTGRGIPEDIRDKLFDPFFTTRTDGTGLGLSIAYEIVRAHNGTISIAPAVTSGTVVTVRLPINGPAVIVS